LLYGPTPGSGGSDGEYDEYDHAAAGRGKIVMKNAIVLGAGMVGVSTALHLQQRGWSVTLVDRKSPGGETSHGNAGIIQREAVEPYAMPSDVASLLAIAFGRTNDVHFRYRDLPHHICALLQYRWHSRAKRYDPIARAYAGLIAHSTVQHERLIVAANADRLISRTGYRVLYRTASAMADAVVKAERLGGEYGLSFGQLSPRQLKASEPALIETGAGAIHWFDPWTVSDPGGLTLAYAGLFESRGGTITTGDAATLTRKSAATWSVQTAGGEIEAEHAIICLGPWSNEVLSRFDHSVTMVRKRGYHKHYRTMEHLRIPTMDVANGYFMAQMAAGLRITTGAHLAEIGSAADPVQLERAEHAARGLIDLGEPVEQQAWFGTRPCMPDMLPVIGQSNKHAGLWMNFGHGHQGFTLGPVTGAMLAAMMSGDTPLADPAPFRLERH
jgi:D-amino-acid dehydrogenase